MQLNDCCRMHACVYIRLHDTLSKLLNDFSYTNAANWTVNNYLIMVKYMRYIYIERSGNFQYNVCVVAETTQVIIKAKFHKYVLSRLYIYYIHKLC